MPFELQPTLTSELLELRPLRADDFEDLFAVAADPLIWEQHPNPERSTRDVFRKFFDDAMESGGAFVAIDHQDGRIIGTSRFNCYDLVRSEIEIGWTFLARSHPAYALARSPIRTDAKTSSLESRALRSHVS